jgi:lipopolysaccharide transport system ATP-binding protein
MASLLEVGTGFHPELTGRENIFLNGAILGMTKNEIKNKFDEIVDFSGCDLYIDTPTKRYSSGMTVRLGFAVAAFLDPEILVVDEVLAVGDIEFQRKALGKMNEVSSNQGKTVLFVSHNMSSISALCKKGLLIENGKIAYFGDVNETIKRYNDSNLKSFTNNSLNDLKLRRGNRKATITTFQIIEKEIESEGKINFSFTVKVNEYIDKLQTSILFKNPNNSKEIITSIPPLTIAHNKLSNEIISFVISIDRNKFREGIYPLYLWIGKVFEEEGLVGENEAYDILDCVNYLDLSTNISSLQLGYDPYSENHGFINLDYNLQILK